MGLRRPIEVVPSPLPQRHKSPTSYSSYSELRFSIVETEALGRACHPVTAAFSDASGRHPCYAWTATHLKNPL